MKTDYPSKLKAIRGSDAVSAVSSGNEPRRASRKGPGVPVAPLSQPRTCDWASRVSDATTGVLDALSKNDLPCGIPVEWSPPGAAWQFGQDADDDDEPFFPPAGSWAPKQESSFLKDCHKSALTLAAVLFRRQAGHGEWSGLIMVACSEYGVEWVCEAIKAAASTMADRSESESSGMRWSYIRAILERWKVRGFSESERRELEYQRELDREKMSAASEKLRSMIPNFKADSADAVISRRIAIDSTRKIGVARQKEFNDRFEEEIGKAEAMIARESPKAPRKVGHGMTAREKLKVFVA